MTEYNFENISPDDFERLANDLLSKKLKIHFESFKPGKDQGIDLRHEGNGEKIIVQCKRYKDGAIRALIKDLASEMPKISKIKPSRYIIFTSAPLSPLNKDEIMKLLHPYCKSTGDILGKEDLNTLLRNHKEIELNHHKLWMPSSGIIQHILNGDIETLSFLTREQIQRKAFQFHKTEHYYNAELALTNHNHVLIAGPAGSGKTAISELLAIKHMQLDYEVVSIISNVREAAKKLNPEKKQLFIYDDFLGQTAFNEKLEKNEEDAILLLIKRCLDSNNTKFILTTREYILNSAYTIYEKLDRSKERFATIKINSEKLDISDKIRIVYSTFYYSNLDKERKSKLLRANCHKELILSENFNPRIVDMSINHDYWKSISAEEHIITINRNISNPTKLWEHIYNNQLSGQPRAVLDVIATFYKGIELSKFREACKTHYKTLQQNLDATAEIFDFHKSVNILEGDFLKSYRSNRSETIEIDTINPSLRDFLEETAKSKGFDKQLFESSIFFEQCTKLVSDHTKSLNLLGKSLNEKLIEKATELIGESIEKNAKRQIPRHLIHLLTWANQISTDTQMVSEKTIFEALNKITTITFGEIYQLYSLIASNKKTTKDHKCKVQKLLEAFVEQNINSDLDYADDLDEWVDLSEISQHYPELISEDSIDELPGLFEDYCMEHIDEFSNEDLDEYDLNDYRDKIESIAHALGCMGSLTDEIEQRLEELENDEDSDAINIRPTINLEKQHTSPVIHTKRTKSSIIDQLFSGLNTDLITEPDESQ